jgi:hypothetical protein
MARTTASIVLAVALVAACAPAGPPSPAAGTSAPADLTGLMGTSSARTGARSASPLPSPTSSPGVADWTALARPLHVPALASGASCPRSPGRKVSPAFGLALGDGPVYAAGLGGDGVLQVVPQDGAWLQKVLWLSAASYQGPVLVRGRALDGSGTVELALGDAPRADQLRLPGAGSGAASGDQPPGWRDWPSYTQVPNPGCYAYQVDGADFSEVIVFEAAPAP